MVLTFKERVIVIKTIDLSEFSDEDRIKITLEDDSVVFLKNDPLYDNGFADVIVDKILSDAAVLDGLYNDMIAARKSKIGIPHYSHNFLGFRWKTYDPPVSLEQYRVLSRLEVWIGKFDYPYDDDLEVGNFLRVVPILPDKGGSGRNIRPAIKSVEFVRV